MNLPITQPLRVELDAVAGGREWAWVFHARRLPGDLLARLREREAGADLADLFTDELLAERITGWESEALRDCQTGETLPCTPANLAALLREAPEVRSVLATALLRANGEAARKNSESSPDGTTAAGRASAPAAAPPGAPGG